MIPGNRHVDVFDNKIENNQNAGVSISSYLVTPKAGSRQDPVYRSYCRGDFTFTTIIFRQRRKSKRRIGQNVLHELRVKDLAGHRL